MKILFTYGAETKEDFESRLPEHLETIPDESVEQIEGSYVIEKVPDLVKFMEECYRILQFDKTAVFTSNHFMSTSAWGVPSVIRGVSEFSLNFTNKSWREVNKYTEIQTTIDFEVAGSFSIDGAFNQRADDFKSFAMQHYNNIIKFLVLTLTKKRPDGEKT